MRDWLRNARLAKGLTQRFVADALGVTVQQYSFLERYKRQKDLNMSTMVGISKTLGVPIRQIVEYEQKIKESA